MTIDFITTTTCIITLVTNIHLEFDKTIHNIIMMVYLLIVASSHTFLFNLHMII